jgi:hypothetical protein
VRASASKYARACGFAECRRLALVWRRLAVWPCSSPPSTAGVLALAVMAGRGLDRQALSPLVNARAQASACEREHSALPALSVAAHLGVSGVGVPQRDCSGPIEAPCAAPAPSVGQRGVRSLSRAGRAL